MQSILFFLSATLSLFSVNSEKETPSVKTPKMALNITAIHNSNEFMPNQWAINSIENDRPIILKSVEDITVDAPLDAPLDAKTHEADVADMKKKGTKMTDIERSNAEFWQRQPLLRWNEFTRELVAAHNVPPRVLPDSSGYPVPNRANPAELPRYPFANPPYASRVFAYVSVAQHDALLVAQFYQTKFQKMSVKEGGQAASSTASRQYPSTEAAVAAASAEVLKFLFPAFITEIEETAEKARQSAYSTGKYAESDVKAGEKIGKAVAQKIIERAQSDGMDAAQGTAAQWQTVFNRRTEGGEMAWISKQKPARPTIEPFFGNVRAWWVSDVAKMRPAAPPATNSDALQKEVAIVKNISRAQSKERMDIIMRWAGAEFSPTPIGHWNIIACDILLKNKNSDIEITRTLALLNRSLMDAGIVCWEAKTFYCYPRPSQVDPTMHPRLPLPNFPSYPSGHAVFSSAAATVLGNIFPSEAENLNKMADEASISRLYAGLHFQMDCDAGKILGKKIGALAIEKVKSEK